MTSDLETNGYTSDKNENYRLIESAVEWILRLPFTLTSVLTCIPVPFGIQACFSGVAFFLFLFSSILISIEGV